mmetsp:Transcript_80943/g.216019  ORF Transcript_80943/g.216019 Transcript_80943/m.216019 type:complete len:554 (+) Transcript_80943:100-1761(+)
MALNTCSNDVWETVYSRTPSPSLLFSISAKMLCTDVILSAGMEYLQVVPNCSKHSTPSPKCSRKKPTIRPPACSLAIHSARATVEQACCWATVRRGESSAQNRPASPVASSTAMIADTGITSSIPAVGMSRPANTCSSAGAGVLTTSASSKVRPRRCLICWGDPMVASLPAAMIPTRCDKASASSMECVVSRIADFPAPAIPWMMSHIARRALGSSPQLGSSITINVGSPMVAMAVESFRLFPPDSWPARACSNRARPQEARRSATTDWSSAPCMPLIPPYSSRCSRTVSRSRSASNWGQYPICFHASRVLLATSTPHTWISPLVAAISPQSMRRVVVFPAPLTPRRPRISPGSMSRDMPRTACTPLKPPPEHPRQEQYTFSTSCSLTATSSGVTVITRRLVCSTEASARLSELISSAPRAPRGMRNRVKQRNCRRDGREYRNSSTKIAEKKNTPCAARHFIAVPAHMSPNGDSGPISTCSATSASTASGTEVFTYPTTAIMNRASKRFTVGRRRKTGVTMRSVVRMSSDRHLPWGKLVVGVSHALGYAYVGS